MIMKQMFIVFAAVLLLLTACDKEETDQEKPAINLNSGSANPQNCDTLWLGEPFIFRAVFTDNQELGSYSIEIHENFDHHSHSTEVEECEHGLEKEPVNPFDFLQDYIIPQGLTSYEPEIEITIPESNPDGPFDEGDYHFFISLTDREGWSAQKGLSVKIMSRP
jgi:hypothetical protein